MKQLSKKMKITIGMVAFILFCMVVSPFIKDEDGGEAEPAQSQEEVSSDLAQEPGSPEQTENTNISSGGGVNENQENVTEEPSDTVTESQAAESVTYEYDELQSLFLELTRDTTPDELLGYIEEYSLEYTTGEYNSSSGKEIEYCIAYTEGAALQKYADPGDHIEVTFGGKNKDEFMFAQYVSIYSAILYDHGIFWNFSDNNAEDYSGYYINDHSSDKNGIVIKYKNGNEAKTSYIRCASGEEAIQKIIDKTAKKTGNPLMDAEIIVSDVMNGTKTEKIGKWAEIQVSKETLKNVTQEQYAEFCEQVVKDSGYNWFTITCEDGTGVQFAGSISYVATYGSLDAEGCITETTGTIMLESDGTYSYTEGE